MEASDELKSEHKMPKPVTTRPAAEYPMRAALETSEPPGGAGVLAPGGLASEDKSATTKILKTDVEAPDEMESEDKMAKPVTARPAAEHPIRVALRRASLRAALGFWRRTGWSPRTSRRKPGS